MGDAKWSVFVDHDSHVGQDAEKMSTKDFEACKRYCDQKGYTGFVHHKGTVYFRTIPAPQLVGGKFAHRGSTLFVKSGGPPMAMATAVPTYAQNPYAQQQQMPAFGQNQFAAQAYQQQGYQQPYVQQGYGQQGYQAAMGGGGGSMQVQPMPMQQQLSQQPQQQMQHQMSQQPPMPPSSQDAPQPTGIDEFRTPPAGFSLTHLSDDQKNAMLSDQKLLDDFIATLPDVKRLSEKLEEVRNEAKEKAGKILEHESEFSLLEDLCKEECEKITAKALIVQELEERKKRIIGQTTPESMQTKLASMAQEAEDAGEEAFARALAGDGLDKNALASLRNEYIEKKKLKHRRWALMQAMVV